MLQHIMAILLWFIIVRFAACLEFRGKSGFTWSFLMTFQNEFGDHYTICIITNLDMRNILSTSSAIQLPFSVFYIYLQRIKQVSMSLMCSQSDGTDEIPCKVIPICKLIPPYILKASTLNLHLNKTITDDQNYLSGFQRIYRIQKRFPGRRTVQGDMVVAGDFASIIVRRNKIWR